MQGGRAMSIQIRAGLDDSQRAAAARLYWDAFGGKLGRVMGPEPKALRFIERVIDPAHVFSAVDPRGDVLGVIGFRSWCGSFVGGNQADMVAIYGRFGAAWRGFCLMTLARDLEPHSLLVDGLAVRADHRSQGIGSALIETLCAQAAANGYKTLRLEVLARNIRARALYTRRGFAVERQIRSRWTALFFAFSSVLVMVRHL